MKYLYFLNRIKKGEIKLNFKKIPNKEIVVFDGASYNDLKFLLDGYKYCIIQNRPERINEISLSLKLIANIVKNFFLLLGTKNFSLPILYYYTILKLIKPRIVLTSIDNSLQFYHLARLLEKHFIFMAIQNANRFDYEENDYQFKKKIEKKNYNLDIFIPNFFCFGDEEEKLSKYYNLKIKKFYKYGSIRVANYLHHINKKKINLRNDLFDICLISEPAIGQNFKFQKQSIEDGFANLAKYTIKFSQENNLKFIFASKRMKGTINFEEEISFYKKYLNKKEISYLLSNFNEKKDLYSSYRAMFQSKVAVACQSTLLRDKIGLNQKILSCNLTNFKMYNFPIEGICTINSCNYKEYAERLKKILDISHDEYFAHINKKYVMAFDKKTSVIEKIRLKINENLN